MRFEYCTDGNGVRFIRQVMYILYLGIISRSSYEGPSAIHFQHHCIHFPVNRLDVVSVVLPLRGNTTPHVPCSVMALPLLTLVISSSGCVLSVFGVWRSGKTKVEVE